MPKFMNKAPVPAVLFFALSSLVACTEQAPQPTAPAEPTTAAPAVVEPPALSPDSRSRVTTNLLDFYVADPRVQNWEGIGTRDGDRLTSNATNGYLMFGPKVPFDAGNYEVTIHGDGLKIGADNSITFDVTSNEGARVYVTQVLDQAASVEPGAPLSTFTFSLPEAVADLEIRAYVTSGAEVTLTRYEVKPTSSP